MMPMRYALIIPAWNEADFLGKTLDGIKVAMAKLAAESAYRGTLVVVDNNSTDDTAAIAEAFGATVVFEPYNQIARARNAGAKSIDPAIEALIFLDADSLCSETLLRAALDRLASGELVGGGSIIAPDKPVLGSALRAISGWNWLSRRAHLAAGCFVFCRRDAFDEIGGFSDKVYAGEELFLSRQLKRWGKKRGQLFRILDVDPVVTSVRKIEWYGPMQLLAQTLLILIPGALFSRRLCRMWYDKGTPRDASRSSPRSS